MSDERLKKGVIEHLRWDDRVNAADIRVEVKSGRLVLTGRVPTYAARRAAERGAMIVSRATAVQNQLVVAPPESQRVPSDAALEERVGHMLKWNPDINASHVTAHARKGAVRLDGAVDAYWKKAKVEELAGSIAGVREVQNHLAVVPKENFTDQVIGEQINAALRRRPSTEPSWVYLKVEDGIVTLSGTMPNWAAYEATLEVARHSAGVLEIQNYLKIG
jgi:osmotically-inducible protein OsmY